MTLIKAAQYTYVLRRRRRGICIRYNGMPEREAEVHRMGYTEREGVHRG